MLPTSFEKIPDVVREIRNLINRSVWVEIEESGYTLFQTYSGDSLSPTKNIFSVKPNQDILVEFIHWKRGLNK